MLICSVVSRAIRGFMSKEEPKYFTPKQFVERHQWLSLGGLRHYLFRRRINGLDESGALIILGKRKIIINESKFIEWMQSQTKLNV